MVCWSLIRKTARSEIIYANVIRKNKIKEKKYGLMTDILLFLKAEDVIASTNETIHQYKI